MLLAKVQPHMATLRSTLYGKRIQAKLVRPNPNPNPNPNANPNPNPKRIQAKLVRRFPQLRTV